MKKVTIMILAFCCFAFSQERAKVAVYMVTPEPKKSNIGSYNMLASRLAESISQGKASAAVNHTSEVLKELKKDNITDRELSELQIKFIGRVLKAQYFCVIEVTPRNKGKNFDFSVRLIDASTGSMVNRASASSSRDQRAVDEVIMRLGRQVTREIEVASLSQTAPADPFARPAPAPAAVNREDRPRIAVYVAGGMEESEKRAAQTIILDGLVKSGTYRTIERTEMFIEELIREQQKQRSGSVDEKQIVALGKQAGAEYICIVDVTQAFGSSQISARIIDVLTAEVLSSGVSSISVNTLDDLTRASAEVIERLLGKRPRR
ncbi:MAG: CsgG/HfaB family protein [Chitinispirillia bacterium]|nr:CsgG/HfaB family protein [Chitinispirillia bacterium]